MSDDIYPLSEKKPEAVATPRGRKLADMTLDAVIKGEVTAADVAITPETLRLQAKIAESAGRDRLARNLERAAELAIIPQDIVMSTYELLRPGRSESSQALRRRAEELRQKFNAALIAGFLEEAADAYDARGFFSKRY
ncbi:diol dehydratase small subunit [Taklimakanibacter deserti]|uniref:diol dehydratase small subunit n=1 Tax=Taklimakanibacter deserti TaxID=2267839 RepID=UPI000E64DF07